MRILITGGAGFLGSSVTAELQRVYPEAALAILDSRRVESTGRMYSYQVDLLAVEQVEQVFAEFQPTHVVHLAATVLRGEAATEAKAYLDHEALLCSTVGELCVKHGVQRLIYTSSSAVYGEPEIVPTPETAPCHPESLYGQAKRAGEVYFESLAQRDKLQVLVLRPASLYGPEQSSGVAYDLLQMAKAGEGLRLMSDGTQTRDFLYVGDAAAVIARTVGSDLVGTYNIGTGVETSLLELVQNIQAISGAIPAVGIPPRAGSGVRRNCLDISRIQLALPYKYTDLATGLRLTLGGGIR